MSVAAAPPDASTDANAKPFLMFPPWPQPPPGATIPVWSEFKPLGIQLHPGDPDAPEVDGRGVPTVRLGSTHSLTVSEQAKAGVRKAPTHKDGKRLAWDERWAEDEPGRMTRIDPAYSAIDRLHRAAEDFKSGRQWPPPLPDCNPGHVWEQWRLYLGLISTVNEEAKGGKKPVEEFEPEDNDSDEEMGDVGERKQTVRVATSSEARPRTQQDNRPTATEDNPFGEPDEAGKARREFWRGHRTGKKEFFLNDPAMAVRIFLSSHYRFKSLIHDRHRCKEGPILISFFMNYLLRNRVFPELEAQLKEAAAVCEVAKRELPATFIVGTTLPDTFSQGLQQLNGYMTQGMYGIGITVGGDGDADSSDSEDEHEDQPDAKKRKVEDEDAEDFSKLEFIDPDKINHDAAARADAIADNVDQNGVEVKPEGWTSWNIDDGVSWENGGWGTSGGDSAENGAAAGEKGTWGWHAEQSEWDKVPENSGVFDQLGPTILPFTHTTGIVERGVRKIEKIVRPDPQNKRQVDISSLSPAELVEEELAGRLGYAVLTPWVKVGNHVASEIIPPQILPDSRGPVVIPKLTKADLKNYSMTGEPTYQPRQEDLESPYPPFDPKKDEIRLLLDPAVLNTIEPYVGMGIMATWVQIARKQEPGDDVQAQFNPWSKKNKGKEKPKGAPGKNGEPTPFWYVEQISFTIPSYYADKYYPDQDTEDE